MTSRARSAAWFAGTRARGFEHLDDRLLDPAIALRSLADVSRCNRWLGGTSAVLSALRPFLSSGARPTDAAPLTLVDVGTGTGDLPAAVRRLAASIGMPVRTLGLEWTVPIASAARAQCGTAVAGDARRLPFADRSVDIVTCAQLLHHFDDADARCVIGELHRVARRCVVIGELRRSWIAAAGLWLLSWPLGFHPVSRHDGVVSVMRGFAGDELATLVRDATAVTPAARNVPAFRVTVAWAVP